MKRYHFSEEEIAEIKAARRKRYDKRIEKRLLALEMRADGMKNAEIATATGYHPEYVIKLVRLYRADGIDRITTLCYQREKEETQKSRFEKVTKRSYPVLITKTGHAVSAFVPAFDITVNGENEADAIQKTQNIVSLWCVILTNCQENLPEASEIEDIKETLDNETAISKIEIDIAKYRGSAKTKLFHRNIGIPIWLYEEAKRADINMAFVFRNALKKELFSKQEKE